MFGVLTNYRDESYLKEHPSIIFETKNKKSEYEIFAVMSVKIYDFQFWKFTMARDENDFNEYVNSTVVYSLKTTGEVPKYGEQILALSTCDNSRGAEWRFVVLAKEV